MPIQAFGGSWTEEKLERLDKYLRAYTQIFTSNEKARFFTRIYVDAFAGTGSRVVLPKGKKTASLFAEDDKDGATLRDGSARIALKVQPGFHRYIFVERDQKRAGELENLRLEFPEKREQIEIHSRDGNEFLQEWCSTMNSAKERAVVFLDPYGMQVEWPTLEAIAQTKAIDLWLLFPLGVAVNRLMTKDQPPPPQWTAALTRTLGTDEWQKFYPDTVEPSLFGNVHLKRKNASLETTAQFFVSRLNSVFEKVAPNPLSLKNSKGTPIFLLCFAAGNPKGAPTAIRIAQHILNQ